MAAYSLSRLVDLLGSKGFVPNNYFTLEGNYRLVEIVNFASAISLIVDLGTKYAIPAQQGKHEYKLTIRPTDGNLLTGPVDEAQLRTAYQEIDHIARALESEEKMLSLYDKPISLKGEENKSQEKFASCYRQMKRFRLCVRNIPYKLALFDDDCLCLLNENGDLETFFVEEYRFKKRKIFVTTSLTNFFNSNDIEQSVSKILEQFYSILNENQKIETNKIQAMIDAKKNITAQSRKILALKEQLSNRILEYQKKHSDLTLRQQDLQRRQKDLRGNSNPMLRAQQEKNGAEITRNDQQLQEYVKIILEARKDLDEVFLLVDNILFDNMSMLTKTLEGFRILDRLKV